MFSILSYQGSPQRYYFTVINVYRFQCLWIGFYEIDETEYGFDDAMRWHDDIDIYTHDFYMMTYMRVVTLVLQVLPVL